jgi:hypothetical protein
MKDSFHSDTKMELRKTADFYEEILMIAIMHLNRKPDYWKTRIT